MGKTKVIAIEGIDGSGKSVQYNKLAEALTDRGYSVEKREYPKYESRRGRCKGGYGGRQEHGPVVCVGPLGGYEEPH